MDNAGNETIPSIGHDDFRFLIKKLTESLTLKLCLAEYSLSFWISGFAYPLFYNFVVLKELNGYTVRISKSSGAFIPAVMFWGQHGRVLEVMGKGNCYQCGLELGCNRRLFRYGQGLEGYRKCQAMDYYLPWKYSREDEPVDTIFDAPTLANDYSVCTWELRA